MSEWIRPTRYFGRRSILLTISRQECCENSVIEQSHDPDEIEREVLPLIAKHRPELVGGIVVGIRFDYMRFAFQILYEHPSLARVPEGFIFPDMPLIPETQVFTGVVTFTPKETRPLFVAKPSTD